MKSKQDIYGFFGKKPGPWIHIIWKNESKKLVKYYEKTLLLNPTAALGSNSPTNTTKQILTRKDPTPKPRKLKKVRNFLTLFLDLLTRQAHPGSVGPHFFGGIHFSEVDLSGKRKKSKKFLTWFFGGATPSDPLAHSGSVEPQIYLSESFSNGSIYRLTSKCTTSQKRKVQLGQLRYQSIENIHTNNWLTHVK
jgi:hypothetical protein